MLNKIIGINMGILSEFAVMLSERKRKITMCKEESNKKPRGKKRKTVLDRIVEFPGKGFIIKEDKLFCENCRKFIDTKKSVIINHLKTKSHNDLKFSLEKKLTDLIYPSITVSGFENLESSHLNFRFLVVEEFLK